MMQLIMPSRQKPHQFILFLLLAGAAWLILAPRNHSRSSELTMGFEQLAELRDRLRSEKEQAKADSPKPAKRKPAPQAKPREQDPAVAAIWPLQKHFPLAFPVNPAPKVPLKEGIFKDAEQHLELLGLTTEQLKLGISTWCKGSRYWASMVENAPRLDLNGQPAGVVTAGQALYAKQQAARQRGKGRKDRAKAKAAAPAPAADTAVEQAAE
jgi:ProP effector